MSEQLPALPRCGCATCRARNERDAWRASADDAEVILAKLDADVAVDMRDIEHWLARHREARQR